MMRTTFLYSIGMSLEYRCTDGIAHVALAHAPVNALSLALRRALIEAIERADADDSVQAIVLRGAGKGFSAGGDRTEFGTPAAIALPALSRDVLTRVEACRKPVVAALHGFAVGGGLELALACSARVAVAGTRVGFPEVGIGVFPLSATQRLPRMLGLAPAAEMMLAGQIVEAGTLRHSRLFDGIVAQEQDLLPMALDFAGRAIEAPPPLVRSWPWRETDPRDEMRSIRAKHPDSSCSPAQRALLEALEAAVEAADFEAGLERAQKLFDELGGNRRPMTSSPSPG